MPLYTMVAVALTPGSGVYSSDLWPRQPTLDGFIKVFTQDHFYLEHFWQQIWNSLFIGVVPSVAVLAIGPIKRFAIVSIRLRGSKTGSASGRDRGGWSVWLPE